MMCLFLDLYCLLCVIGFVVACIFECLSRFVSVCEFVVWLLLVGLGNWFNCAVIALWIRLCLWF